MYAKSRFGIIVTALALLSVGQGCLLTRVATVPMRVGGAALTIIPYAGDAAHETLDEAASVIDEAPF
ncbi:MAG: hypothetical protein GXP31_11015 [Kiritimatiellaeota bacterium]|nr:hypothetical protein [Kiritimatiellota bacterium]